MIADSTILIYLAKIGKLSLLPQFFTKIYIPEAVKREAVDEGKKLHQPDALLIENAIQEGWIIVKKIAPFEILKEMGIDQGETEAISLAIEMKQKEILVDQTHARIAAELMGLKPRGTLFVLFKALKEKEITYPEYRSLLESLIQVGFRMSEEVYLNALKLAEQFKK